MSSTGLTWVTDGGVEARQGVHVGLLVWLLVGPWPGERNKSSASQQQRGAQRISLCQCQSLCLCRCPACRWQCCKELCRSFKFHCKASSSQHQPAVWRLLLEPASLWWPEDPDIFVGLRFNHFFSLGFGSCWLWSSIMGLENEWITEFRHHFTNNESRHVQEIFGSQISEYT